MTITLGLPTLVLIAVSIVLFMVAWLVCHWQGLFDGLDNLGIGGSFIALLFSIIWAIPSVLAWAIYATWFR